MAAASGFSAVEVVLMIGAAIVFLILLGWLAQRMAGDRDFKIRASLLPPSFSFEVRTPPGETSSERADADGRPRRKQDRPRR